MTSQGLRSIDEAECRLLLHSRTLGRVGLHIADQLAIFPVYYAVMDHDIVFRTDPGTKLDVTMHDGSHLRLKKMEQEYDPTNKIHAVQRLMESREKGEVLTGVFYINAHAPSFIDMLNVTDQPLATLPESVTRPSREVLAKCMEELR